MLMRSGYKLVLSLSLGVLLMTFGLFSMAAADRRAPAPAQVASRAHDQARPAVSTAASNDVSTASNDVSTAEANEAQQCSQQTAPTVLDTLLGGASTQLTCPSGQSVTCCACGCGCRKPLTSPANFCIQFCPPP